MAGERPCFCAFDPIYTPATLSPPFRPPQAHRPFHSGGLRESGDSLAASSIPSQTLGPKGSSSDLIVLAPDLLSTPHLASTSWERDRKCTSNYSLRGKEGGSVPAHWLQATATASDQERVGETAKPRSDCLPWPSTAPSCAGLRPKRPLIRKTLGGRGWGTAT